jgi:hypothetical protein
MNLFYENSIASTLQHDTQNQYQALVWTGIMQVF